MIHLKNTPVPFTPPWYKKGEGSTFMIRPGDVIEREMFEAEMSGQYDAARVMRYEINAAFRDGVSHLLSDSPEHLEALLEIDARAREIETFNAGVFVEALGVPEDQRAAFIENKQQTLPASDRQTLEEAERVLKQHWPDYRALVAQEERRRAMVPLTAFRRFCVGWEGPEVPFSTGPDDLVTAEAIQGLGQNDMKSAGLYAYQLLYATTEERSRKNSSAPSNVVDAPTTSPSGAASKKAGTSRASGGPRTRAS